jgi:asparagine synthase (glutamine-hydrolysing)
MCGIAGIVAADGPAHRARVAAMVAELRHRGPDDEGIRVFDRCALGHARLSIVDPAAGHQPMDSPVGAASIVFNGEIYGYREIRDRLQAFPFRTRSDTEVILALYHRYGAKLLEHLPGMFAFALWDDAHGSLLCARDRFGEKPLYFAVGQDGAFVFASEIKAVLASGLVRPVLDRSALAHYLQYLYVPPDRTIYVNVHTLPPAHALAWRDGKLSVQRYWDLPERTPDVGLSDAAERIDGLIAAAVGRQLVADVPVGAFLSGGMDSSTVVAAAARHGGRVKTFSFAFEAGRVDERAFARPVAARYGCDHHELVDADSDIAELLVTMQRVYDEPFADSSNIATYLIARLAREQVKVVLTGDGGDELFGGYSEWYRPLRWMESIPAAAVALAPVVRRFVRLGAALAGKRGSDGTRAFLTGLDLRRRHASPAAAHQARKRYFSDADLGALGLVPGTAPEPARTYPDDPVDAALRTDLVSYLPGDILVKTDRASMAHGLELRAPLLDVALATFCVGLPSRLKVQSGADKVVLRAATRSLLPEAVLARPKQGFGAPVGEWLRRKPVADLKAAYLNDPTRRIFDLLPFDATRRHVQGDDYRAWILLVLALWAEDRAFDLVEAA